jgi:hypothetical protein
MNKLYYIIKENPKKTTQELIDMIGFDFRFTDLLYDLVISEKIEGAGIFVDNTGRKHLRWRVR